MEAPVLTVGNDASVVERRLVAGRLGCPDPGCGQHLAPWGYARVRAVRGAYQARWRWRPRRARCAGCRRTHVLLPVAGLVRRADGVVVIGAALVAKAAGMGHRPIAAWLGRPAGTVRGGRFGRLDASRNAAVTAAGHTAT